METKNQLKKIQIQISQSIKLKEFYSKNKTKMHKWFKTESRLMKKMYKIFGSRKLIYFNYVSGNAGDTGATLPLLYAYENNIFNWFNEKPKYIFRYQFLCWFDKTPLEELSVPIVNEYMRLQAHRDILKILIANET